MKIFFKEEKISFNEFRVLAVLHEHKILKKNEVINENLFETTEKTQTEMMGFAHIENPYDECRPFRKHIFFENCENDNILCV